MSSHNVLLTNKGFKVFNSNFFFDILSIVFLFLFTGAGLIKEGLVINAIVFLALASLFYLYFRLKVGYIYAIGFFFQIFIFFLTLPRFALKNPAVLVFCLVVYILLIVKQNTFYQVRFPSGLFLSIIGVAFAFVLDKIYIARIEVFPTNWDIPLEKIYKIPGIYFPSLYTDIDTYSYGLFSLAETYGGYLVFFLGFIFLREQNFKLDFLMISLMSLVIIYFYRFDVFFYARNILNYIAIWYLIYSAPGRSYSFSARYNILSMVLTLGFSYFWISFLPLTSPVLFIIFFFLFYGVIFYLVTENFPGKNLFMKNSL